MDTGGKTYNVERVLRSNILSSVSTLPHVLDGKSARAHIPFPPLKSWLHPTTFFV